jgi:hypothetical protein
MAVVLQTLARTLLVTAALVILIGAEILRVYYVMPFPGSQESEAVSIAYFFYDYIIYFRIAGWLLLIYGLVRSWSHISISAKVIVTIIFAFYLFIAVLFNYYFVADHIFYQPKNKKFLTAAKSTIDERQLVLGVFINGEAKAYPLEIIGYHHQVQDTVGGEPVMVTYCTVCRTGRVYSPIIDGKPERFRLVGMDQFNAMFEDASTRSWWRQVNGEAVAGPQKGKKLVEIAAEQMSLRAWLQQHMDSKIMQPDTLYQLGYDDLKEFDEGTLESGLEKRDSLSWKDKSWIVGIELGKKARAYDWNELSKERVINDTLNHQNLLIALENDSVSFHTWKRDTLVFSWDQSKQKLIDNNTNSIWGWNGECVEGALKGSKLPHVQSYQEFWHSWKTFKPQTTRYSK